MSILFFGWTVQYPKKVHIAVPVVGTFITGWTVVSTQPVAMTYLVDIFPTRSAAAIASLNLARCLSVAGGTRFIILSVDAVGVGLAFAICAAVQAAALVGVGVQWKLGAA